MKNLTIKVDNDFNISEAGNFFFYEDGESLVTRTNNHIYEFDLSSGEQINKLTIPFEGPNSIPSISPFDGICKINESVFLYVVHFLNKFLAVNNNGGINSFYEFSEEQASYMNVFAATYAPLISTEKYILAPNFVNPRFDLKDKTCLSAVDKKTMDVVHKIAFPEKYNMSFWGDHPYQYLPTVQYIEDLHKYYISFPIEDNIYVYNSDFVFEKKVEVKSKHIGNILPLREGRLEQDEEVNGFVDKDYFRRLSYYFTAFYDKKNQLYYRVAKYHNEEHGVNSEDQFSLVVCDKELTPLGELRLDGGKYSIFYSFVSSQGLMLFNSSKFVNDSEMPFDLVEIVVKPI